MTFFKSYATIITNAGVAELADAPDLGSGGFPCRFKSCRPHQMQNGEHEAPRFCILRGDVMRTCPSALL